MVIPKTSFTVCFILCINLKDSDSEIGGILGPCLQTSSMLEKMAEKLLKVEEELRESESRDLSWEMESKKPS